MLDKKKLVIANYSEIFTSKSTEINLVKLKHPKTNDLHSFLIVKDGKKKSAIFELVSYSQDISSVFIDNYVQSDSVTYFATKFDIVYFLLSLADNEFISIEELKEKLAKENSLEKDVLKELSVELKTLEKMFDVETESKLVKIKNNKSKCLKWLVGKVKALEDHLKANHQIMKVDTKVKTELADNKFQMEAFELMSQYIAKPLSDSLRKDLNISSPLDSNENKIKRCKSEMKEEVVVE